MNQITLKKYIPLKYYIHCFKCSSNQCCHHILRIMDKYWHVNAPDHSLLQHQLAGTKLFLHCRPITSFSTLSFYIFFKTFLPRVLNSIALRYQCPPQILHTHHFPLTKSLLQISPLALFPTVFWPSPLFPHRSLWLMSGVKKLWSPNELRIWLQSGLGFCFCV